MKKHQIFPVLVAACLGGLALAGCSQRAKTHYSLQRANAMFESGQFDRAESEYLNVLRADPRNAQAIGRLGLIYYNEGRFQKAAPYLYKGSEMSSSNLELRVKLGIICLAIGDRKEAHDQAAFVLKNNPANSEAPVLLAQSAAQGQFASLKQQFNGLIAQGDSAPLETALGILASRQDHVKDALEKFQRALNLKSQFAPAYDALANTYLQIHQVKKAADAFKAASECASITSPLQTEYGQFEIQTGNSRVAEGFFNALTQKVPDYMPAWLGLAEVALDERKFDDSAAALKRVLDSDPQNADALVLKARLELAQGHTDDAIAELEHLVKTFPRAPHMHYQLALAYIMGEKTDKAINQLHETLDLNPDFAQPAILLAQLDVQRGDVESALTLLKPLVARHPDMIDAKLLLADVYRLQKDFNDALAIYQQLERTYPKDPKIPLLAGSACVQQLKEDAARVQFNRALQVDPGNVSAQEELAQLDMVDKNFDAAEQRVQNLIAKNPGQAPLQILLAKIFLDRGQTNRAEEALSKAATLPDGLQANFILAQLYFNVKQDKDALDTLNVAITKEPRNPSLLMLAAEIQSDQRDYVNAAATYEKLLAVSPQYSPALNNLAWLYSDHLGDLAKAYALAQRARQLLPNDPSTADTLGWILFKRGDYTSALSLFQQSAGGLPGNPEVQFHLGLTYYMLDNEDSARQQLQNALSLTAPFADRIGCQKYLNILNIDPTGADSAARDILEKQFSEQPADPIAFSRLEAIYRRDNNAAKAAELCHTALKANPKNAKAMVLLAQLCETQDRQKALELAKSAYQLSPNDADVCSTLGRLAFLTGDDQWAFTLLDEASQDQPTNGQTLFDLANAAFCLGKVSEAQTDMQNAMQSGLSRVQAVRAKNFLDMITMGKNPRQAGASHADIQSIVASEPDDAAALYAQAVADSENNDAAGAEGAYEKLLARHPNCSIACKNLAILYAQTLADPAKAYPVALKAREAFPDDPRVARALAMVLFRKGDYDGAANLFNSVSNSPGADARLFYCLGICEYHLKNFLETKTSLERALNLNLSGQEAADARQTLSELH